MWGIDLSVISNQGKAAKRFEFVVKTEDMIYAIETNFYGSGGSKLNKTARSYKMLSQESDTVEGFTFVWFTDGIGWRSARENLRETTLHKKGATFTKCSNFSRFSQFLN